MALSGLFGFFGALSSIQAFTAIVAIVAIVPLEAVIRIRITPVHISHGMTRHRQLAGGQYFNELAHRWRQFAPTLIDNRERACERSLAKLQEFE